MSLLLQTCVCRHTSLTRTQSLHNVYYWFMNSLSSNLLSVVDKSFIFAVLLLTFFFFFVPLYYFFLCIERAVSSAAPQSETPTVSFQRRHITMQPAFTVRLRAPQANWTPHKASDNCCPPLWGLFCWHSLSGAECRGGNEWNHRGWGGKRVRGGGGVAPWNLTGIPEQSVLRGRALLFLTSQGFQGFSALTGRQEGFDKAAPLSKSPFH